MFHAACADWGAASHGSWSDTLQPKRHSSCFEWHSPSEPTIPPFAGENTQSPLSRTLGDNCACSDHR
ncbi:hypothetical protein FR483_n676L [Paramecium bursaria Chlorella virus FR483]|uniref:Uncharacterized protein n676L n=1 Tax=Paramecium bursaria Chlorella virus FR483 TaxID=399781 RepID=A7J830_PBCVF|nr:hypothetical protein FR483_n676L [Paramecium bursaria Chlorella virus FR483]ABT15961.1 hypothetical protein FR483_n676L [Paramecium bursaria Chlorella virus FR483]